MARVLSCSREFRCRSGDCRSRRLRELVPLLGVAKGWSLLADADYLCRYMGLGAYFGYFVRYVDHSD